MGLTGPGGSGFLGPALEARPDALALADARRRWTFRELAADADALAERLGASQQGGAEQGASEQGAGEQGGPGAASLPARVVAVLHPPTAEAVLAIHGVARAGGVVAPLHPRLTEHELAAALRVLRPAAMVVAADAVHRLRSAARAAGVALESEAEPVAGAGMLLRAGGGARRSADRGHATVESEPPASASGRPTVEGNRAVPAKDAAAAVIWTSGTAGRPRGVVLSGAALRYVAEASRERLGLSPADRWLASLSPAHVGGLALITRAALLGAAVVARGAFDAAEAAGLMEAGDVTHASLVPVQLRRLLDHREGQPAPPALRCLLVGGAAAGRALVERALAAGYPVATTYGLTEATSQVATAPPALLRRKPDTVGAPLPGVEVRFDEEGEIEVRGPTVALGTVGEGGLVLLAEGGWLRTGDLGTRDDEGHLRITGRRSDRIVTGGVTVDPGEVETVLLAHPAVREAAVVGLPDREWGERVAAAVVVEPGGPSRLDDVEALCRERLTSAKVPRRLLVVGGLPRNPNGKVDRAAVRELLEGED